MSFRPNVKAEIYRFAGTDLFGQPSWGPVEEIKLGVVHLNGMSTKTSVRTDSSASRGNAKEDVVDAKFLIEPFYEPKVQDRIVFLGQTLMINAVEPRISVAGKLDHYECGLEMYLGV